MLNRTTMVKLTNSNFNIEQTKFEITSNTTKIIKGECVQLIRWNKMWYKFKLESFSNHWSHPNGTCLQNRLCRCVQSTKLYLENPPVVNLIKHVDINELWTRCCMNQAKITSTIVEIIRSTSVNDYTAYWEYQLSRNDIQFSWVLKVYLILKGYWLCFILM